MRSRLPFLLAATAVIVAIGSNPRWARVGQWVKAGFEVVEHHPRGEVSSRRFWCSCAGDSVSLAGADRPVRERSDAPAR
jgi:hypothetical protein